MSIVRDHSGYFATFVVVYDGDEISVAGSWQRREMSEVQPCVLWSILPGLFCLLYSAEKRLGHDSCSGRETVVGGDKVLSAVLARRSV